MCKPSHEKGSTDLADFSKGSVRNRRDSVCSKGNYWGIHRICRKFGWYKKFHDTTKNVRRFTTETKWLKQLYSIHNGEFGLVWLQKTKMYVSNYNQFRFSK